MHLKGSRATWEFLQGKFHGFVGECGPQTDRLRVLEYWFSADLAEVIPIIV